MNLMKHKIYRPSSNKITEETAEMKTLGSRFHLHLNTKTVDDIVSSGSDILQDYKIKDFCLKEAPSNIEVDYKKAVYKIQLNKADWDKVFEADNMPIDYDAIKQFVEDTKKFYE